MKSSPPVLDIRRSVRRIERFNVVAGPTGIMGIVAIVSPRPDEHVPKTLDRNQGIINPDPLDVTSLPRVHCSKMDPTY
jgi:hypothetical protein